MALITLAQWKTLLGVTSTDATRDARITALLPYLEDDIVTYCNNDFLNTDVAFSGNFVLTVPGGTTYTLTCALGGISDTSLAIGDNILLEGTIRNDGRYTIATVSDTVITVTEAITAESAIDAEVTLIAWPVGLKLYAARMISYQVDHMADAGITGEVIKSYSYTRRQYGEMADPGYPQELTRGLDRWRLLKTGHAQVRTHYSDKRGTWTGSVI